MLPRRREAAPFFFNAAATTEIYTLSLHDALPISATVGPAPNRSTSVGVARIPTRVTGTPISRASQTPSMPWARDRKSTRLNSSHVEISYAVFCLKKKKKNQKRGHDDADKA